MIRIIVKDNVVIYDEIGWDHLTFHEPKILQELIKNHIKDIYQIEFLNVERAMVVRLNKDTNGEMLISDYWCRNIDFGLLNFMCQMPEFYIPVKRFFTSSHLSLSSCLVQQYPLLTAVLLGNNSEH